MASLRQRLHGASPLPVSWNFYCGQYLARWLCTQCNSTVLAFPALLPRPHRLGVIVGVVRAAAAIPLRLVLLLNLLLALLHDLLHGGGFPVLAARRACKRGLGGKGAVLRHQQRLCLARQHTSGTLLLPPAHPPAVCLPRSKCFELRTRPEPRLGELTCCSEASLVAALTFVRALRLTEQSDARCRCCKERGCSRLLEFPCRLLCLSCFCPSPALPRPKRAWSSSDQTLSITSAYKALPAPVC